jgi:hypothetical protein
VIARRLKTLGFKRVRPPVGVISAWREQAQGFEAPVSLGERMATGYVFSSASSAVRNRADGPIFRGSWFRYAPQLVDSGLQW